MWLGPIDHFKGNMAGGCMLRAINGKLTGTKMFIPIRLTRENTTTQDLLQSTMILFTLSICLGMVC